MHRYDPVDLQQSFAAAQEAARAERQRIVHRPSRPGDDDAAAALTVKEQELADSGLSNLVQVTTGADIGDRSLSPQRNLFSPRTPVATGVEHSNPLVSPEDNNYGSIESGIVSEVNHWEANRQDNDDESFFSMGNDDDSDDDLL